MTAFSSQYRQQGGTILGFCIGLLVGLLIALGISIMINKVPMKIKGDPNSRTMTLEEELERNRNWDPNAPLRSRTPNLNDEKEADGVATEDMDTERSESAESEAQDAGSVRDGAAPAGTVPPSAPSGSADSDPLGDLARAVAGQVSSGRPAGNTVVGSADERLIFFVQTGAYRNAAMAEEQRVRLSLVGFSARVTEREQAGRPIYRVRLGPFNTRDQAQRAKTRLESHDFVGSLVRVPR